MHNYRLNIHLHTGPEVARSPADKLSAVESKISRTICRGRQKSGVEKRNLLVDIDKIELLEATVQSKKVFTNSSLFKL